VSSGFPRNPFPFPLPYTTLAHFIPLLTYFACFLFQKALPRVPSLACSAASNAPGFTTLAISSCFRESITIIVPCHGFPLDRKFFSFREIFESKPAETQRVLFPPHRERQNTLFSLRMLESLPNFLWCAISALIPIFLFSAQQFSSPSSFRIPPHGFLQTPLFSPIFP